MFSYRLWKAVPGMSHVCVDSDLLSGNICAAIDTASRANTCVKERGDCFFWSNVSVQPAGTEYEDGLDEGKGGNKHLRTPQARIIFRDFSKMRRRGSRRRQSTREDRPASLSALPLFCIFSYVSALCSSCWPISMTFRGNRAWSLYYKVLALGSFLWSI